MIANDEELKGTRARIAYFEDFPSCPNSCLGTRDGETPFRVRSLRGTRDGSFAEGVPEQEFGNERNEGRRRPPADSS